MDDMNDGSGCKMILSVTLCLVLCSLPAIDSLDDDVSTYFLSEDVGPWSSTKHNCTLAKPAFTTDENGKFILEEDAELLRALANEEDWIWVGYFKAYQNFQYIGCVDIDTIPKTNVRFFIKNDPGLCYSVCHTKYVGIVPHKGPNCYCLPSMKTFTSKKHCHESCSGFLCGGKKHRKYFMSLYKIEKLHAELASQNGGCCYKDLDENLLIWDDCQQTYEAVCIKGGNDFVVEDPEYSWMNAMKKCLSDDLTPLTASENRINIKDNPKVWTAMIRSEAVFNISVEVEGPSPKGYIKRMGKNRFELKFTKKNGNHKYLCIAVTRESTATLSGKQMGSGVYVGVSIGVLLGLGILAVVVVFLWRKRCNRTPLQGEAHYANQVENAGCESNHPVSVNLQNENKKTTEILESVYDEIGNETRRVGQISNEYDTTKAVRVNANLGVTDNVYNRLGELEDMYNHVGPSVTEEQASTYGYNCGKGPEKNTGDANHEYFTLEEGHGAKYPEKQKSGTNGDVLSEQDSDEISHEYFTLRPSNLAGKHEDTKLETCGNILSVQDNDGENHEYFILEPGLGAGQPGQSK